MSASLRRLNAIEAVLVALVAASAGLLAFWGGAAVGEVAAASLAGLVLGVGLAAYLRSISPTPDVRDRGVERGKRR